MLAAPRADRFESIDMLRGIAVLGIFAINIQAMANTHYHFMDPTHDPAFLETGVTWWAIATTWFQFKFITIFSALFGAGIVLMVGDEKPSGGKVSIHYRRMFWLALFGAFHGFALWFGDILLPYAFTGCIAVLMRRWNAITLLIVGLIIVSLGGLMMWGQGVMLENMPPEQLEEAMAMFSPSAEEMAKEEAGLLAAWPGRIGHMFPTSLQFELMQTLALLPRTLGVMMLGMALFKFGFFTLRWSIIAYLIATVIALPTGAYGSHMATGIMIAENFSMPDAMGAQTPLYAGSLLQSFGYASLVMLISKLIGGTIFTKPFAAAGRMALSNYIGCTLAGVFVFYGAPGLGKLGEFTYGDMAIMVGAVWLVILIVSPIWLSIFRFGPLEWLWRTLTYMRPQPLLK